MPLPDARRKLVQAPASAGVGLRFDYEHRPPADWPADWWQRNYDEPPDDPGPPPLAGRQLSVPPSPEAT